MKQTLNNTTAPLSKVMQTNIDRLKTISKTISDRGYNQQSIKTAEIEHSIRVNLLNFKPVLFFGRPGIGKTEEIVRVAKSIVKDDSRYFNIDGTQTKYEAIEGLMYVTTNGEMVNSPLPQIKALETLVTSDEFKNSDDQVVIVFIDEMSSFDPGDQRVLLNMINERRTSSGIKLPKSTMFILAANPSQDQKGFGADAIDAAVHPVEEAVKTRCAVYVVDYSISDFFEYATDKGFHDVIIETLRRTPEMFNRYKDESFESHQTIVPRTLSSLNDMLNMAETYGIKLTQSDFASHVGADAGAFYKNYTTLLDAAIDFKSLLSGDSASMKAFEKLEDSVQNIYLIRNIRLANDLGVRLADYDDVLKELIDKSFYAEHGKTLATIQYDFLKEAQDRNPNAKNVDFNHFGDKVTAWLQTNKGMRDGTLSI